MSQVWRKIIIFAHQYNIKMTQKDFIVSVQKSCHLEHQQCDMLLNALSKLMAKAGVEQIPVTLQGLGTFTSHKHPEYIKEDPETGLQTLYPPRISYRMQSVDNKVQPDLLSKQLAEIAKTPVEDTRRFLSALVNSILAVLKKGEEVEVKGLGTFRVINSNQGDIQRIAYTPDEQMKQQVNAPFNCFEPVVIKASVDPVVNPVGEKGTVEKDPSVNIPRVQEKPTATVDPISVSSNDAEIKHVMEPSSEDKPNSEPKDEKVSRQEPKDEVTPKPVARHTNKRGGKEKTNASDDKSYDEELLKEIQRNNRMLFFILISLIVISLGALCKFLLFPDVDKDDPAVEVEQTPVMEEEPSTDITFDQKTAEEIEAAAKALREDSIEQARIRWQKYKKWRMRVASDTTANKSSNASDTMVTLPQTKTTIATDSASLTEKENVTEDNKTQDPLQEDRPTETVPAENASDALPVNTDSTHSATATVPTTTAAPVLNPDTSRTIKQKADSLAPKE